MYSSLPHLEPTPPGKAEHQALHVATLTLTNYSQPAETTRHTVYTETTFPRLGERAIPSNSLEQTQEVK